MFEAVICIAMLIAVVAGFVWMAEQVSSYFEEEQCFNVDMIDY